jgi:hypothetical protein
MTIKFKLNLFAILSFICITVISNCAAPPSSTLELTATAVSQQTPVQTDTLSIGAKEQSPETSPFEVRLAWYYNKPRTDEDMLQIVNWYDFFILIKGDEKSRDQMLSLGARGPILQYLDFEAIHDPGSCDEWPQENQVADQPGDFCRISQDHPNWFLLDENGERMLISEDDYDWYLMDPGNTGWRDFFLERVRQNMTDANWDGVFLDNVEVTFAFFEDDERLPAQYPTEAGYQVAVQSFLEYIHTQYFQPNGKLLFANLVARKDDANWTKYISHLDGVMHEGWAIDWPDRFRSPETWEKHIALAEGTQEMGKDIILVSQGTKDDLELQQFAFASYLLVNQGRAIFRYANSSKYREIWVYDNYNVQLGDPLGLRYKDGNAWRRDFTNGTVMVNPETHESQIQLK